MTCSPPCASRSLPDEPPAGAAGTKCPARSWALEHHARGEKDDSPPGGRVICKLCQVFVKGALIQQKKHLETALYGQRGVTNSAEGPGKGMTLSALSTLSLLSVLSGPSAIKLGAPIHSPRLHRTGLTVLVAGTYSDLLYTGVTVTLPFLRPILNKNHCYPCPGLGLQH